MKFFTVIIVLFILVSLIACFKETIVDCYNYACCTIGQNQLCTEECKDACPCMDKGGCCCDGITCKLQCDCEDCSNLCK